MPPAMPRALRHGTLQSPRKVPVEVNDYPGFVANRILMPMINEAIITLHEGVADVRPSIRS